MMAGGSEELSVTVYHSVCLLLQLLLGTGDGCRATESPRIALSCSDCSRLH